MSASKKRPMQDEVIGVTSGAGVTSVLDDLARQLGRKPRVYVMDHKDRSREETTRLIKSSDICVQKAAWDLIDDRSRYEWVNE